MSVERLAFLADHLAQPLANLRAVDVVVVGPALVARVVRRVDVDTLDLPRVARQQRLQGVQVVALDDEVALILLIRVYPPPANFRSSVRARVRAGGKALPCGV